MTVESIQFPNSTNLRTTEVIRCVWFDENNHVQRDAFDDFALERLPQP